MKSTIYWIILLIIVIIAGIAIWQIGYEKPKPIPPVPEEKEPIKIGILLSLTGPISPFGNQALGAIQLAIEEINNKGGIKGRVLKIIVEDTKSEPKEAVTAFNKLANIDKVPVVIGPLASSLGMACAPIAQEKKIVLFSPAVSALEFTKIGDYIFRNWPTAEILAKDMAEFAFEKLKLKKIAILYVNNEMGVNYKTFFEKRFSDLGGEIVISEKFEQGATDFKTQLTKIKSKNPEAIYLLGQKENGIVLRQIKEMEIKALILSNVGVEDPEIIKLAKEAAEGVIYNTPGFAENFQKTKDYKKNYQSRYHKESGIMAASAYDAVYIVAKAIEKAKVYTGEEIKNSLKTIKNFQGITGLTNFDENGDVIKPSTFKTVKNGQFVPYEK
jgi:branched-chain amino acid transport system substrate-binding protein